MEAQDVQIWQNMPLIVAIVSVVLSLLSALACRTILSTDGGGIPAALIGIATFVGSVVFALVAAGALVIGYVGSPPATVLIIVGGIFGAMGAASFLSGIFGHWKQPAMSFVFGLALVASGIFIGITSTFF